LIVGILDLARPVAARRARRLQGAEGLYPGEVEYRWKGERSFFNPFPFRMMVSR